MALCGRKWFVYLSFYGIALFWLVWLSDRSIQLLPAASPFEIQPTPSDDEVEHLFKNDLHNSTWFSSSTTCKEFLLGGAAEDPIANAGSRYEPEMFEWGGGGWINPPEALNNTWVEQQAFLGSDGGEATFSITPAASIEVEWGKLTTFGGRLALKEFWNSRVTAGDGDLKLMLHGAFVSTGVDRRVCMTGCAFRIDYPNERDCGFVLKMKYPNRPSLALSRVEGELSSQRSPGDPLHIPALRILGPRGFAYEFCSEEFLQTELNMSSSNNIDNNGTASPRDLVSYLEGPSMQSPPYSSQGSGVEYIALVAPTPAERSQIGEQGKVVVGPFSTPCYPLQEVPSPSTVELVLRFKNVVTRLTATGSRRVLVSASMTASLCYHSSLDYTSRVDQQAPFNMEGIWDPGSEELCMLGSREAVIFPWKLCLKLVLRRYVSIDSPLEGAVLSGPNFASLALLRSGGSHQLTSYRYTVAAKAEELARRATSPELEALKDTRWFHPRFPAPTDVPDFYTAAEKMRSALEMWRGRAHGADGELMDLDLRAFTVTFLESCGGPNLDVPWDAALKVPVAGSYLRVAAQLELARTDRGQFYNGRPCQCHAEGVYEPFTGQLHLVVHQRQISEHIDGVAVQAVASPWPLERNGGGDVEAVEDSEIYMQLQFPSEDWTMSLWDEEALDPEPMYMHQGVYMCRYNKVNMRVESLRSQSDPLYFKPLVAKNYPNYKPSPNITIVSDPFIYPRSSGAPRLSLGWVHFSRRLTFGVLKIFLAIIGACGYKLPLEVPLP